MVAPVVDASEPLYSVLDEFVRCIDTGEAPSTDGWSGIRVLALLSAIDESRRNNGAPVAVEVGKWLR
jgi:hypothetical protein